VTIWSMGIACLITKATNTHTHCVILLFHCNSGYTKAPPCYFNTYVAVFLFVPSYVCISFCMCAQLRFSVCKCKQNCVINVISSLGVCTMYLTWIQFLFDSIHVYNFYNFT
jgi:hypothetical protein